MFFLDKQLISSLKEIIKIIQGTFQALLKSYYQMHIAYIFSNFK